MVNAAVQRDKTVEKYRRQGKCRRRIRKFMGGKGRGMWKQVRWKRELKEVRGCGSKYAGKEN